MPHKKLITRILQRYWRVSRGLTLEVRACAQDASGRVLLVRSSQAGVWKLPGGTVVRGETAVMAVERWLRRDGHLEVTAAPRLAGIVPGMPPASSDQIALYLVLSWRDLSEEAANPLRAFFAPGEVPADLDAATRVWMQTVNEARVAPQVW